MNETSKSYDDGIREARQESGACSECDHFGYFASENDSTGVEIERCDLCQFFDNDDLAMRQAMRDMQGGSQVALEHILRVALPNRMAESIFQEALKIELEQGNAGLGDGIIEREDQEGEKYHLFECPKCESGGSVRFIEPVYEYRNPSLEDDGMLHIYWDNEHSDGEGGHFLCQDCMHTWPISERVSELIEWD